MPTNVRYLGPDGATPLAGVLEDFGQMVSSQSAVVVAASRKVFLENISDRALGKSPTFTTLRLVRDEVLGNDGVLYFFTAADPNGTLSKPWGAGLAAGSVPTGSPTAAVGGSGGAWGTTGVRAVVVTAENDAGETPASVEITFDVTDPSKKWLYTWVQVPGNTTGYNVYRSDVPGTFGPYSFVAHVAGGAVVTYLDDGSPTTVGAPPPDNTTGATVYEPYGDPPPAVDHTSADKVISSGGAGLAVGQQWVFWLDAKAPVGATGVGNKRIMRVLPLEA